MPRIDALSRGFSMRNLILAATTLVLASLASPLVNPAAAAAYPYCAEGTFSGGGCDYATIEQCRAYISGAGYCAKNPLYPSGANATPSRAPRPRR
jgi:Protein of unknown function (DUF3551)